MELTNNDIQEEVRRYVQCYVCKRKLREENYALLRLAFAANQEGWVKFNDKIYCKDCKERHAKC